MQNSILFSSHCQAYFGFFLCSPTASPTWVGTWHFNRSVPDRCLESFRAFPSHFPVVSPTPAPCTSHGYSTLQRTWSSRPLQHCLWCFLSPTGTVRDADAECGTEAVTFLVSAVPADDVGGLGFFPLARLLQPNPPHSAVPSPAAGSRLEGQCRAAGSASLSPLRHLASAETQPVLAPRWTISSGCSEPLQNNGLGVEGQPVFQEKTVMDSFYLSFNLLGDQRRS